MVSDPERVRALENHSLDTLLLSLSRLIPLLLFNGKLRLRRLPILLRKQPSRDRIPELSALVRKLSFWRAHLLRDYIERRQIYKSGVFCF